jgi:hypothetical protein
MPFLVNCGFHRAEMAGSVAGLTRKEIGLHIQALYALPLGTGARVMLGGGPSIFDISRLLF